MCPIYPYEFTVSEKKKRSTLLEALTAHHTPTSCQIMAPPVAWISLGSSVDQRVILRNYFYVTV
jgi:hypothetical protein